MVNDDESPSSVYGGQVHDIIRTQARESTYQPAEALELFIRNRRQVTTLDELEPDERVQLVAMFRGEDVAQVLRDGIEDMPVDMEVAAVVDASGTLRFRLYGWNYGVIWLMPPSGLDVIAFTAQHDMELWHEDQRATFWAMDRALARNDHGFQQPSKFGWWEDRRWAEIKDRPRGTAASEPYIRKQMAGTD